MKHRNTWKLLILLTYSMCLCHHPLISQACATNGPVITRQSQIDSFEIKYGSCGKIDDYLIISGANITSLAGLLQLTRIEGNLSINYSENLISQYGLNNLTFVGGSIQIGHNDRLELIDDLAKINSIHADLEICSNSRLKNLFGFNELQSIDGVLLIYENPIAKDFEKEIVWGSHVLKISAFPKLENILGLLIGGNPSIV